MTQDSTADRRRKYIAAMDDKKGTQAMAERDAALARERALLEGNESNRKALVKHNADHAAEVARLKARVAELKAAGKIAVQELHTIVGMDFMGVSAVAYNAARALEVALSREGGE